MIRISSTQNRVRANRYRPRLRPVFDTLESRCLLAVRTWTGAGADDLWSNPANWDTGVPVDGDDVVIPDVAAASAEVHFDSSVPGSDVTLNSLTSSEPFRISSDTLTFDGTGVFAFQAGLTMAAGTIAGPDDFSISEAEPCLTTTRGKLWISRGI